VWPIRISVISPSAVTDLRYSWITWSRREHRPSNAPGLSGFTHHAGRLSEHYSTTNSSSGPVWRRSTGQTLGTAASRSSSAHLAIVAYTGVVKATIGKTRRVCTFRKHTSAQNTRLLASVSSPIHIVDKDVTGDPQEEYDRLNGVLTNSLDRPHYSERTVTITSADPPYITASVKSILRRKNQLMRSRRIEAAAVIVVKIGDAIRQFNSAELCRVDVIADAKTIRNNLLVKLIILLSYFRSLDSLVQHKLFQSYCTVWLWVMAIEKSWIRYMCCLAKKHPENKETHSADTFLFSTFNKRLFSTSCVHGQWVLCAHAYLMIPISLGLLLTTQ